MKRVIALRHFQYDSYCDMMFNTACHYGLMYQEYNNEMLFFIREEISDERTALFFGDLLCCIFKTTYSNHQYSYPEKQPDYEIGIYDILFAFIDHVRKRTDERHYKEQFRKVFKQMNIDMSENLPAIHLLKDNTYTLTPTESYHSGYDVKQRTAKWKLNGKTKKEQGVRNKNKRATYRNFNWENLYENCVLFRDFVNGDIEKTDSVYMLARCMCGAEKGKQKFLEIINSEKNSDKYYRLIHWKEILTAIIKDDVPVAKCENCEYCDCCSHSDNMLSTAKPKMREVRVLKKEKYVSVEKAYQELQNAFQKAVEARDNKIHIISGQTALGKTSTYINYMKNSIKPIIIAVPTHELKEQVVRDSKCAGVEDICCTPDIRNYGISPEIIGETDSIYRIGAGAYVLKFLVSQLQKLDNKSSDYDGICRYLRDCKSSARFKGHIVTTHAKLMHIPQDVLESHEIIIDEDILRNILRTETVDIETVKKIRNSGILPEYIASYLSGICMKRGYHFMDGLDVFSDENQLEKLNGTDANIYGLLKSNYINIKNGKITFLIEEKLPDCKLIILSATISHEIYRKVYSDRIIEYYECPKAAYRGRIIQYTDSSYSRYGLKDNYDLKRSLADLCRDCVVITFSCIENDFNTRYHFGNVEGINNLKGRNLAVIGLPNVDDVVYCLYGMRMGTDVGKANMYPQRITYKNKSFYLNTYKNEVLQMIQTWIISSQLEQAVGRARLLREECTVMVFAGFPVEQAEYHDKEFVRYTD